MAGFLKKVANAFVEIEGAEASHAESSAVESATSSIDAITRETSALIAQLETGSPRHKKTARAAAVASQRSGGSKEGAGGTPQNSPTGDQKALGSEPTSVMELTADAVFAQAGVEDSPNSAQRMLKLIAGLSMFPLEQQVVMVRAMDAADDSWEERQVLEDARNRQGLLRRHLQAIEQERGERTTDLDARIEKTNRDGAEKLADIDRRIAALQKDRSDVVAAMTQVVEQMNQEKTQLAATADGASRRITQVINAFSQLLTFFQDSPNGAGQDS